MRFVTYRIVAGLWSLAVFRMARWLALTPPAVIAHVPGINPDGIVHPENRQRPANQQSIQL